MRITPVSSLAKIFPYESRYEAERVDRVSLLLGETGGVQFAVEDDACREVSISVECPLPVRTSVVGEVYCDKSLADDPPKNSVVLNNADIGFYPDPIEETGDTINTEKGKTLVLYCEITGETPGDYTLTVTAGSTKASVNVHVGRSALPEQSLICTNWFHSDCIMSYYSTQAFDGEYWRITENFVGNAVRHGINMILTPLFTLALDTEVGGERPTVQLVGVRKKGYRYEFDYTNFDRWVEMCLRNGVKYFELSHLFTQWGAKHAPKIMAETSTGYRRIFGWETSSTSRGYMSFLRQLGKSLTEHTDKLGITDMCYIHCSDEPSVRDIRRYRKTAAAIKEFFPSYTHIDALSDYRFCEEGLVDLPVPNESDIDGFKGRVDRLWTYYCCGPIEENYPNRFLFLPLIKMRIIGVLLYKYGCEGFLQWGFNFWYTQYSRRLVNPFVETTSGGSFPAGDGFIVYPGENGEPICSVREKSFRDGVNDYEALKLLEAKKGREYAERLITRCLGDITFTSYPLETSVFEAFRNELVKELD